MWTTEDGRMHRFTNANSTHALAQVHEQTQQNTRERRPLQDALTQVPHKTLLGTKKCWHRRMHWCVCITIPHTLKGTQRLFVVNSDKLNLTALIIMMYDDYNIIFTDLVIWILVSWYCIAIFNFSFIFLFCKDVWLDERFHLKARS